VPALDLFPWQAWARLVANRARELGPATAGYSDSLGYRPLREAVARYVAVARGVTCTRDQVVIVGGSQQGLDLVARVVTDPGDSAWIEDPGYYGALGAFVAAGLDVTGVPVDAKPFEFMVKTLDVNFDVRPHGLEVEQDRNELMVLRGSIFTADDEDRERVEKVITATLDGKPLPIVWTAGERQHGFTINGIVRKTQEQELILKWDGAPLNPYPLLKQAVIAE
jgi:hypothetical protein